ncbi:MAG: 23S rRNA (adenine(2503)-C(2))-methyltransferase RlmN [Chloroflexota bacterium]|nr:MAG: 23S rRNA (adenine(2503)-C(2))-methyltransferase RlmN [Chloroflexota bacterium]
MSPNASNVAAVVAPLIPSRPAWARDPRPGLSGLTPDALADWLADRGQPAYRARQVRDALWSGGAVTTDRMRTLPVVLRGALDEAFRIDTLGATEIARADAGLTEKALHLLDDGRAVESVLMRYPARGGRRERATVCISSQAGCAVACPFCATGELGFLRDLEAAEIVDQVRFWQRRLGAEGRRVTNVVFMGMGEPLLNLDPVLAAAEALTDRARFGLGGRHLTLSTSGVVPAMRRLVALAPPWTLAVSLHAARPALRAVLVPLERRYPLAEVVAAADAYAAATGRRVSYEFVMIDGINDTEEDARAAAALLRGRLAHVNLILMNPVAHTSWRPSPPARIAAFAATVRVAGIAVTVRRNRGIDIGAACGQLAAEQAGAPSPAAVARRRAALERDSAAALALGAAG